MSAPRHLNFGNVFRQGWEETARLVFRSSRGWAVPRRVLVAPDGVVYATRSAPDSKWGMKSAGVFIGNYTEQARPNEIEDDLLDYFRELSAQAPIEAVLGSIVQKERNDERC